MSKDLAFKAAEAIVRAHSVDRVRRFLRTWLLLSMLPAALFTAASIHDMGFKPDHVGFFIAGTAVFAVPVLGLLIVKWVIFG